MIPTRAFHCFSRARTVDRRFGEELWDGICGVVVSRRAAAQISKSLSVTRRNRTPPSSGKWWFLPTSTQLAGMYDYRPLWNLKCALGLSGCGRRQNKTSRFDPSSSPKADGLLPIPRHFNDPILDPAQDQGVCGPGRYLCSE